MIGNDSLAKEQIEQTRVAHTFILNSKKYVGEEVIADLMEGSVDVHIHAGPDVTYRRMWDEIDVGLHASSERMATVVFKCHSAPSASRVDIVQKAVNQWSIMKGVKPVKVEGGVVLNYSVGGFNPKAVEMAACFGGKFVWTPTLDSSHHKKVSGLSGGIEVLDAKGNCRKEVKDVFSVIAENDMVLSLSHQSVKERFVLIKEAKQIGVKRILVDHPYLHVVRATVSQIAEMAEMGAHIGFYWQTLVSNSGVNVEPNIMMEILAKVGPYKLVSGTDAGQMQNPMPSEALKLFIKLLILQGVSKRDIKLIFRDNPSRLIYD